MMSGSIDSVAGAGLKKFLAILQNGQVLPAPTASKIIHNLS